MDLNASHIGFVIGAYALSLILLLGLVILTITRDRKLRHEAARLDESRRKDAR